MDHYGQVLGLQNFKGAVTVTGSTFKNNKLHYESCSVGSNIQSTYTSGFTELNKYTAKMNGREDSSRVYSSQMKNLISIRVDDSKLVQQPIKIYGNTFEDNAAIKGLVYLDLPQRTDAEVLLVGNTVSLTFSYYHTAVFHIRNRVSSVLSESDMTAEA